MIRRKFSNVLVAALSTFVFYSGLVVAFAMGLYLVYRVMVQKVLEVTLKNSILNFICGGLKIVFVIIILSSIFFLFYDLIRSSRREIVIRWPASQEFLPEVDAVVRDVAAVLQVTPPDRIYLTSGAVAAVSESPKGARTLFLGWPCIRILSKTELKAVIAHELAHFDDSAFVLDRALWNMELVAENARNVLNKDNQLDMLAIPVNIYYILFRLVYNQIVKMIGYRFEIYCDCKSASYYGSNNLVAALEKILFYQVSLGNYVNQHRGAPLPESFFDDVIQNYNAMQNSPDKGVLLARIGDLPSRDHPTLNQRRHAVSAIPPRPCYGDWISYPWDMKARLEKHLLAIG